MTWNKWSRGFWRSACGRYDMIEVRDGGTTYWVVYDFDLGVRHRAADRADCERWCADRARATPC